MDGLHIIELVTNLTWICDQWGLKGPVGNFCLMSPDTKIPCTYLLFHNSQSVSHVGPRPRWVPALPLSCSTLSFHFIKVSQECVLWSLSVFLVIQTSVSMRCCLGSQERPHYHSHFHCLSLFPNNTFSLYIIWLLLLLQPKAFPQQKQ